MYELRSYRHSLKADSLFKFEVKIDETDMLIRTTSELFEIAYRLTRFLRHQIQKYIQLHLSFLRSLKPMEVDLEAPKIVQAMQAASMKAGVGPMAAVAGALAEFIGNALKKRSQEVMVENGGDIYLYTQKERLIQIYSGSSILNKKIAIKINPESSPVGICTSSRTVGHSLSFGITDASCVMAKSACLADALATALGNRIKSEGSMTKVLDNFFATYGNDILGAVVIVGGKLAYIGDIELVKL
jgi:hypothetical protein